MQSYGKCVDELAAFDPDRIANLERSRIQAVVAASVLGSALSLSLIILAFSAVLSYRRMAHIGAIPIRNKIRGLALHVKPTTPADERHTTVVPFFALHSDKLT
jgi:hypothetical protein